jgi:hypothetical protein
MIRQRWGTFSVIDAQDPARLAPEVLLYDKLVIPVPKTADDTRRWKGEGWHPDLQERHVEDLGDLAVQAQWGNEEQLDWAQHFENLRFDLQGIIDESKNELAYQCTRVVLAQKKYPLPAGIDDIDPIAAFQSESDFRTMFPPGSRADAVQDLTLKLSRKMAIPQMGRDPEGTLKSVILLARELEYQQKRRRVYEKQDHILSSQGPTLEDVQELGQLSEELADYVKLMLTEVAFTQTIAVAALPPGYGAGFPVPAFRTRSVSLSSGPMGPNRRMLALRPPGSAPSKAMYHDQA